MQMCVCSFTKGSSEVHTFERKENEASSAHVKLSLSLPCIKLSVLKNEKHHVTLLLRAYKSLAVFL